MYISTSYLACAASFPLCVALGLDDLPLEYGVEDELDERSGRGHGEVVLLLYGLHLNLTPHCTPENYF